MKYSLVLLTAFLISTGPSAMSEPIFPYRYAKDILPNGLTVIMIPMASPGLIAYYSIVRTGSRDEVEKGKSGFAHFFEHMMFRGTKKYPGPVYDSMMTSIGADANAYTTDDYTAYHLNFAKEDLGTVVELESDRFQNLSYSKPAFQTEAGAVYGEYRKSITNPYSVLNEKMQDLAYDVHTYKHTTIGFERDIKAMPEAFDYSKTFFQRFYRPDNVVLLIAGDVDTVQTMDIIRRYYGQWKSGYVAPKIVPEPPQKGERSEGVTYPGKTLPIIDIAYKGDAFDPSNRDYVAALLLDDLAFGTTSDLYKKLVIKEQKVQFISSSFPMNRDKPLFEIYSMVKNEEFLDSVRDDVYRTIERFQTVPVDEQRLSDLKRRNKYSFLMNLDTPDNVAGNLARLVAITGGIEAVDVLYNHFQTITVQDIMEAAQKYLTPERRSIVILKGARS
jgi:zinc protease